MISYKDLIRFYVFNEIKKWVRILNTNFRDKTVLRYNYKNHTNYPFFLCQIENTNFYLYFTMFSKFPVRKM